MSISAKIIELISDDYYLLWEIGAQTHKKNDDNLDIVITETCKLVMSGSVACYARPVVSSHAARKMSTEEATEALNNINNWLPPASDLVDAVWLGMNDRNLLGHSPVDSR